MKIFHFNRLLVLAMLLPALSARAEESSWDLAASLDLQTRYFTHDARWARQGSAATQLSVAATAELRWRSDGGDQRASFIPYLRWDESDDERSLADLREAYWAYEGDGYELLVGANTVFWGVTESVHLVDIINQTDAVADIDGEDKLGQPMVNLELQRDWGLLSVYVMPTFRERTFAGPGGRLRTPLPVDSARAIYESSAGQKHVDVALRYSHYIGDVDIGLSVFSGTSREPRLVPDSSGSGLLPAYDQIDQFGIDLQYTRDAWLWKFEAIARDGFAGSFAAAAGGFEYTYYQVGGTAVDLGMLLEYQYDGRREEEPLSLADNDVFAGARLALNDTQDTAVLAGLGYDADSGEIFFSVEADRRLGQDFVLEFRLRGFSGAGPQDASYVLAQDDYVQLQLSRYF